MTYGFLYVYNSAVLSPCRNNWFPMKAEASGFFCSQQLGVFCSNCLLNSSPQHTAPCPRPARLFTMARTPDVNERTRGSTQIALLSPQGPHLLSRWRGVQWSAHTELRSGLAWAVGRETSREDTTAGPCTYMELLSDHKRHLCSRHKIQKCIR